MRYNWDDHQKTCFRLYIDENKSLEDIMEYLKVHHKFTPSKRAFQTQFRKWEFPSKQNPAYKNDRLVARVKELWEKNLPQREMLRILGQDGFDIKKRDLMQVRTRNKWFLRVPNGDKPAGSPGLSGHSQELPDESRPSSRGSVRSLQARTIMTESSPDSTPYQEDYTQGMDGGEDGEEVDEEGEKGVDEEERSRRRRAERKRRRRTRGWRGEPADPPGPPRYPSETTIDEARVILSLDNDGYRAIRTAFQAICEENGVVKKTLAGPETWETVKDQLVRQVPQLQAPFWGSADNLESKKLALDVICTDVTKRMRVLEKRITLTEAKTVLGIDPEEARQLRTSFYQLIQEAQVTCKSGIGPDHWNKLKEKWMKGSDILQRMFQPGAEGPESQEKLKALEVLASDVMKRARDDKSRRDARRKKSAEAKANANNREAQSQSQSSFNANPSPPADEEMQQESPVSHVDSNDTMDTGDFDHVTPLPQIQLVPSPAHTPMHVQVPVPLASQGAGLQGDDLSQGHSQHRLLPSMLDSPANIPLDSQMGTPLLLSHDGSASYVDQQYVQQFAVPQAFHHQVPPQPMAIAIYLRLHPQSTFVTGTNLWIATLSSHSLQELRHVAAEKFRGAMCLRVEGILKDGKGNEIPLQIDQDEELAAYLAHLEGATPTFDVQLVWSG